MTEVNIIERFLNKNFLISPDFLECYDGKDETIMKAFDGKEGPLVLNKDLVFVLKNNDKLAEINWVEFDKSRATLEKGKEEKIYNTFLDILSCRLSPECGRSLDNISNNGRKVEQEIVVESPGDIAGAIVTRNYIDEENKKKEVSHFVQYFRARYNTLKDVLLSRPELQGTLSINRVICKKEREGVSIIGMVFDKRKTKNGNLVITLEDLTGIVNILVNKGKEGLFSIAEDLALDEIVGVIGTFSDGVIYAEKIYFPDVPMTNNVKRCSDDVKVAFISDIHVGSIYFLEKQFLNFIGWLNNKDDLARNIKYLFIVGDLVEGIGVFPDQEKTLTIFDVKQQYKELARYLSLIRKDIQIIMCPGDHDALRLAHPQPAITKELSEDIVALPNVVLVTNPSMVNIHSSRTFPGFDILLYHGHGYHYFIDNVESLRKGDTLENPRKIMKFLLQKRHLAPTHSSSVYVPDSKYDPLIIDKVPDVFVSGHLHRSDVGVYRNVITISCSCWQARTDFQIKVDNHPDPGTVPILNLKTRNVEILHF